MSTLAPTEPLMQVAYYYDGSIEGLFTAIFMAYARHEDPQDILSGTCVQPRIEQSILEIETDYSLATRVRNVIIKRYDWRVFYTVLQASCSDDPRAGTIVYRFIRYAIPAGRRGTSAAETGKSKTTACSPHCDTAHQQRSSSDHSEANVLAAVPPSIAHLCQPKHQPRKAYILNQLTHPAVGPLVSLARSVSNEQERMRQFVRFQHMQGGIWFGLCNPKASVVPLLMHWFAERFDTQSFVLYDENHHLAGIYDGSDWQIVKTDKLQAPRILEEEELMQAAWRRFYDAIAIEARYNPELRQQFMPKRLWKNLPEMQPWLDA